jgi:hypothetical protein
MQIDQRAFDESDMLVPSGPEVASTKAAAHRVFQKVACLWGLTDRQRNLVFDGMPSFASISVKDLYFDEVLRDHEAEVLANVSEVLEIFLLCRAIFEDDAVIKSWLRTPDEGYLAGIAPMTWLVYGGKEGLKQLKAHLVSLDRSHAATMSQFHSLLHRRERRSSLL